MSMTAQELDARVTWQDALQGKPFIHRSSSRPVIRPDLAKWWVHLPPVRPQPAPDVQMMVHALRRWTGWSTRLLAAVLGTSHTTVSKIEDGRAIWESRSGDLRRRISDAYDVVGRVATLVGSDPGGIAAAMTGGGRDGRSATDFLREGQPNRAYLAVLDGFGEPARSRSGLLVGDRPSRPGQATVPLTD